MSTANWKAELQRRIKNIKEKKAAERKTGERVTAAPGPAGPVAAKPALAKQSLGEIPPASEATPHLPERSPPPADEVKLRRIRELSESPSADEESVPAPLRGDLFVFADAEGEQARPEEDELTLFGAAGAKPKEYRAADRTGLKPKRIKPAAPGASDLDDVLDSYTPLDSAPAQSERPIAADRKAASPVSAPAPVAKQIPYGRLVRRTLAAAADVIIVLCSQAVIVMLSAMLLSVQPMQLVTLSPIPLAGLFFLLHFIYYVPFTALTGQTPGKLLFGLRTVSEEGRPSGLAATIMRWLAALVSAAPLAIGYFWFFAREDGRAWHDILLGTTVEDFRAGR